MTINNIKSLINRLPSSGREEGALIKVQGSGTEAKVEAATRPLLDTMIKDNFRWALRVCMRPLHEGLDDELAEGNQVIKEVVERLKSGIAEEENGVSFVDMPPGLISQRIRELKDVNALLSGKLTSLKTELQSYRSLSSWGRVSNQKVSELERNINELDEASKSLAAEIAFSEAVLGVTNRNRHFVPSALNSRDPFVPADVSRKGGLKGIETQIKEHIASEKNRLKSPELKIRIQETGEIAFETDGVGRTLWNILPGSSKASLGDTLNMIKEIIQEYQAVLRGVDQFANPEERIRIAKRSVCDLEVIRNVFEDLINSYSRDAKGSKDLAREFKAKEFLAQFDQLWKLNKQWQDYLIQNMAPESESVAAPSISEEMKEHMVAFQIAPTEDFAHRPLPVAQPRVAPQPQATAPQERAPAPAPVRSPSPPAVAPADQLPQVAGGKQEWAGGLYYFRTHDGDVYTDLAPFEPKEMEKLREISRKQHAAQGYSADLRRQGK